MLSWDLELFQVIEGLKVRDIVYQQTVMSAEWNLSRIQIQIK